MVKEYPLADFCREHGQKKAAKIIGCTQGNVSQMISSGRQVFIVEDDSLKEPDRLSYYEIKGRQRHKRSA